MSPRDWWKRRSRGVVSSDDVLLSAGVIDAQVVDALVLLAGIFLFHGV